MFNFKVYVIPNSNKIVYSHLKRNSLNLSGYISMLNYKARYFGTVSNTFQSKPKENYHLNLGIYLTYINEPML